MFNANEEIVVFNRRYLDMYKLSPQVVKPGCTFRELIRHRTEVGLLKADPEPYYRRIIDNVRQRKTTRSLIKTTEGRFIQVFNQPMSGGGWVTTHEDVTERRHAEDQVREQKLQLDTALNNMSQGLNMFDAAGRLVVCNERYLRDVWPLRRCGEARMLGGGAGPRAHRQRHVLRGRSAAVHRRSAGHHAQARIPPAPPWSCRTAASSP